FREQGLQSLSLQLKLPALGNPSDWLFVFSVTQ
ncbi:hypothetical protein M2447_002793, partial [Ereboglobus sp. PH5-10]|nr:hypothetical protein [Ereboglobus sp. PH5-10]